MSSNVVFNGVTYSIPDEGDSSWGPDLSAYLVSLAANTFQRSGGSFVLTAETNFGGTFGLKIPYIKSQATNPSATGVVRLGNAETISWRNAANSSDLAFTVSGSNVLLFNGAPLLTSGAGSIVNADISASAAIAYSKLNLTGAILNADLAGSIAYAKLILTGSILNADLAGGIAFSKMAALTISRALTSDASGIVSASAATSTELGYLSGVTSAIQTQLNAKEATITATTSADYYRGDKTFQTLNKTAVGLSNVDNTSDATKNSASATLTSKTINGSSNTITNVSLTTGVTGTLPIANGGTGQTSAANAINALLPSQTSNSGKILGTDGTNSSWVTSASTPSVNFAWSDRTNPTSNNTVNFSEGIQTITFTGTGKYKITLNNSSTHSDVYTASRVVFNLGGTATRSDRMGAAIIQDGIDAQDTNQYNSTVIYGSFTNGQTVTILPSAQCNYSSGTHVFTASYLLEYLP